MHDVMLSIQELEKHAGIITNFLESFSFEVKRFTGRTVDELSLGERVRMVKLFCTVAGKINS